MKQFTALHSFECYIKVSLLDIGYLIKITEMEEKDIIS